MPSIDSSQIKELAKQYATPFYLFDEDSIRAQCRSLKSAISYPETIFRYACKALSIGAILQIIKSEGYLVDCSSFNETLRCLRAGYLPNQILYTGEGADANEFQHMLAIGIELNCSSLDQMALIGKLKSGSNISVRFNPGEGHGHHHKVNTGGPYSKHGIYLDQIDEVKALAGRYALKINGIHTHIGSGTDLEHWLKIKDITLEIANQFEDVAFIDLGGGLPVVYNPDKDFPMDINHWGQALSQSMADYSTKRGRPIKLEIEPGRFLVASSGILVSEVQAFKTTPTHNFVIINSGFNHNIRPAMYGAYHTISAIKQKNPSNVSTKEYVIAGNLCESGDVFTCSEDGSVETRKLPELEIGDLIVTEMVGAYSHSMMSEYNSMNLPASLLRRSNGEIKPIERRGTLDDILRREV